MTRVVVKFVVHGISILWDDAKEHGMARTYTDAVETSLSSELSKRCLDKVKTSHGDSAGADEDVYLTLPKPFTDDFHESIRVVPNDAPKLYPRSKTPEGRLQKRTICISDEV